MGLIQSTEDRKESPTFPQKKEFSLWDQGTSLFSRISRLKILDLPAPKNMWVNSTSFIYLYMYVSINTCIQYIYAHSLSLLFLWKALIHIFVQMWWHYSQQTKSSRTRKAYLRFSSGKKKSNSFKYNQLKYISKHHWYPHMNSTQICVCTLPFSIVLKSRQSLGDIT